MISLALRILPVWRWIKANPLLCLCAILALWGAWERSGRMKALDQRDQCRTASQAAAEETKALRAAERKEYQEKAHEADLEYRAALADARSDTARYIAAHRVRPSGGVSPAKPIGEAGNAGQLEAVPSGFVLVAESDVRNAADWQAYGVTCHNYLVSVTQP